VVVDITRGLSCPVEASKAGLARCKDERLWESAFRCSVRISATFLKVNVLTTRVFNYAAASSSGQIRAHRRATSALLLSIRKSRNWYGEVY